MALINTEDFDNDKILWVYGFLTDRTNFEIRFQQIKVEFSRGLYLLLSEKITSSKECLEKPTIDI